MPSRPKRKSGDGTLSIRLAPRLIKLLEELATRQGVEGGAEGLAEAIVRRAAERAEVREQALTVERAPPPKLATKPARAGAAAGPHAIDFQAVEARAAGQGSWQSLFLLSLEGRGRKR